MNATILKFYWYHFKKTSRWREVSITFFAPSKTFYEENFELQRAGEVFFSDKIIASFGRFFD